MLATPEEEQAQHKAFRAVRKAAGKIQSALGQAVVLRYTPRLKFVMDEARNRGDRVLQILDELEQDSLRDNPNEIDTTEDH